MNDLSKYGYRQDYNPDNRRVGSDTVTFEGNDYWISTVDLGINHRFGEGEPLYYETMIFKADKQEGVDYCDLYCDRYTTRDEAQYCHNKIVKAFNENKVKIDSSGYIEFEDFGVI